MKAAVVYLTVIQGVACAQEIDAGVRSGNAQRISGSSQLHMVPRDVKNRGSAVAIE